MSLTKTPSDSNKPHENNEHVAILRSAHGRADETFYTVASFIVSPDGVRLLAGRHITKRAASALARNVDVWERSQVVRQFPTRPRPSSPSGEKVRAA